MVPKVSNQVSQTEFHGQIDVGNTACDLHQESRTHEHIKGSEKSSGEETFFILLNPEFPKLI